MPIGIQSPYQPPMSPTSPQQAEYSRRMGRLQRNYTELPDGKWVKNEDLKRLEQQDKEQGTSYAQIAREKGLDAVYKAIDADKKAFEASHTQVRSGEWMTNEAWQKILDQDKAEGTSYAKIAQSQGIDAMNDQIKKDFEQFKSSHTQLGSGEWVPNDEWQKLVDADKANGTDFAKIAQEKGLEAANTAIEQWATQSDKTTKEFKDTHFEVRNGEWVTNEDWQKILDFDKANGTNYAKVAQKDGIDAMNAAMQQEVMKDEKQYEQWKSTHVELGDGQWITKEAYDTIKAADAKNGTNYAGIALKSGISAMEKAVDADFKADNYKLKSGEWVSLSDWNEIKAYDKENGTNYAYIADLKGLDAMNAAMQADYQQAQQAWGDFTKTHIQLGADEWITTTQWNQLNSMTLPDSREAMNTILKQNGTIDALKKLTYDTRLEAKGMLGVYKDMVASNPDIYPYSVIGMLLGYDAMVAAINKDIKAAQQVQQVPFTAKDIIDNPGITDDAKLILLKGIDQGIIIPKSYTSPTAFDIPLSIQEIMLSKGITDEAKYQLTKALEAGIITYKMEVPVAISEIMANPKLTTEAKNVLMEGIAVGIVQPAPESVNRLKQMFTFTAELLVPGVYLARNWNSLPDWQKGLVAGLDLLFFVPVIGEAGHGARVVSVAGKAGTAARLESALSYGGKEIIRQILFPVELLKTAGSLGKPVKVATRVGEIETLTGMKAVQKNTINVIQAFGGKIKGSLSSIETLVRPTKLPESVVTDIYHTIKIPISKFDSLEQAFKYRADMIKAASKSGNAIVVDIGDSVITIKRSPLMRELGGGISHSTPVGDVFQTGMVVEWKKGMPLIEQGIFTSPEVSMRFSQMSAFGVTGGVKGTKPAVYITSPALAAKAETTTKIYKGMLEGEAVFKVGVDLPKPQQVLFTRMGHNGTRVDLLLEKRLTKTQILKLKAEGLIEQVKNFYQPSITITNKTGKTLDAAEIEKLAKIIGETDKGLARNIRAVAAEPEALFRVFGRLSQPTAYRVSNVYGDNRIQMVVSEAQRKPNETDTSYVARINREVVKGTVPRSDLDRIVTESNRGIRESKRTPAPRVDTKELYKPLSRLTTGKQAVRELGRPRISGETPRRGAPRSPRVERMLRLADEPLRAKVPLPEDDKKPTTDIPAGSIAWRQGIVWKYIPPPWLQDKPISTRMAPTGATLGGRTPAQTVQMIGKPDASVPESFVIDMGVTDIYVTDYGKTIKFKGKGLKTRASGVRSRTKGMRQGISTSK